MFLLAVAPLGAWAGPVVEPGFAADPQQAAKPPPSAEPHEPVEPRKPAEPADEASPAEAAAEPDAIELPIPGSAWAPPRPAAPPATVTHLLPRSLGKTFDRQFLLDLPGQGLWSLFATVESTAILDRIDGAGMYVGEAGLLGIRGSSWTQASWTMGELDITDPDRTGTPLFFADPDQIEAVEIAAGLSPADQRGIGPGISLILRRPGEAWRKSLQLS